MRDTRLREIRPDEDLEVLRLLIDRRDEPSRARTQGLNRAHRLFAEFLPGGAPTKQRTSQYQALLAGIRPRDTAGRRLRRRLLVEELAEVARLDARLKAVTAERTDAVRSRGSHLLDLPGIGPAGAARILADVGDVARFPSRHHLASWTGTAPIDASSGAHIRHRLSRAGNRRLNHVLHIAATVQLRHQTAGRVYHDRKRGEGKRGLEALRCLKRRISDAVYRQLVADAAAAAASTSAAADEHVLVDVEAGPGGHRRASLTSSAAGSHPNTGTSDQSRPGPAPSTVATAPSPQQPCTAG